MDENDYRNNIILSSVFIIILIGIAGFFLTFFAGCSTDNVSSLEKLDIDEDLEESLKENAGCNPDFNPKALKLHV